MDQPQEKAPSLKASAVNINQEDILQVKAKFPILQKLDKSNENFLKLAQLIKEMATTPYDVTKKYEVMYKVIKIGGLFEVLLPEIEVKSPVETLGNITSNASISKLHPVEMMALFKIAKNSSADAFHILYEDQVKSFLGNFSLLCQGNNVNPVPFLELSRFCTKVSRGKNVEALLSDSAVGKARINKLLCQMGYFLLKAKEFGMQENYDGACMALLASGSCGRFFNISKCNPVPTSIARLLSDLRTNLSHLYKSGYNESNFLAVLQDAAKNEVISRHVEKIKTEAASIGNPVDIDAYYAKKETSGSKPESPRAYERNVLKH